MWYGESIPTCSVEFISVEAIYSLSTIINIFNYRRTKEIVNKMSLSFVLTQKLSSFISPIFI